jgi:hypothetical protein
MPVKRCSAQGLRSVATENLAAGVGSRELAGGDRSPSSPHATCNKRNDKQHQEYEEKNFRNACRACCDAAEAEQRRY